MVSLIQWWLTVKAVFSTTNTSRDSWHLHQNLIIISFYCYFFLKWWHHNFNSHSQIVFAALIELLLVSKQGNIITLTPNLLQKHNCCWQVWSSKISSWWQTEWIEKKMATPDNASNKGRGMLGEHSNGSPNQKGKLIRVIKLAIKVTNV